jgi:hypothetical protein
MRGSRVVEPRYPFAGAEGQTCVGDKELCGDAVGRSGDFGSGDPVGERGTSAELAATTPGAINLAVTPKTIGETICARGWTRLVRPPVQYTEELKRQQIRTFGYDDRRLSQYEEDHLIPLGLGGAPSDPRNLWPEPRTSPDGWGADRKDELEFALNQLVCAGRLSLREAQRAIATDWTAAYRRYVGLPR